MICGSGKSREIFRNYHDKHFAKLSHLGKEPSIVVRCSHCGLVYHNPRLDEDELGLIYSKLYRPEKPDPDYLNDKSKKFEERAQWLKEKTGQSTGAILDIGCAEGSSLLAFKKYGWDVFGVEPSESFSEFGRKELGFDIITGFFSPEVFKGRKFDVISIIRVLEHISDPADLLAASKQKLKEGGYLFIEVPNLMQPRNDISKHFFNSTTLYNFSVNTLGNLLSKNGWQVQNCSVLNGGIRVLASPVAGGRSLVLLKPEPLILIKTIILLHGIRWFMATRLKPAVKVALKKILLKNGSFTE